jgi:hypothetical protein
MIMVSERHLRAAAQGISQVVHHLQQGRKVVLNSGNTEEVQEGQDMQRWEKNNYSGTHREVPTVVHTEKVDKLLLQPSYHRRLNIYTAFKTTP